MIKLKILILMIAMFLIVPSAFAILQPKVPYCWDDSNSNSNFSEHSSNTASGSIVAQIPNNLSANISNGQVINTTGIFSNQKKAIALTGSGSYMFVDGNLSKKTNILKSNNSGFCIAFNYSSLNLNDRYSLFSFSDQWDNGDNRVLHWGVEGGGSGNDNIFVDAQLATSPDTRTIGNTVSGVVNPGNKTFVCFGGNGTNYITWINGQYQTMTISDPPYVWLNHTTNNFQSLVFGAAHDFQQRFRNNLNGWISQIFFWNTTMTPEDFNAVWNNSRPLPCDQILGQNASSTPPDTTLPIVNTSINSSVIDFGGVYNFSGNITDETALNACSIGINQTGSTIFYNFTFSGTNATCSQNFTISAGGGNIINFSMRVNDTSGNYKINSTIITVADRVPVGITLINLTTEGGLGQLVNLSNLNCLNADSVGCKVPKTNSSTPSFFVVTNKTGTCAIIDNDRNLNWTDIYLGNTNNDTEGTTHSLTLNQTNATGRFGLFNFSIGCKNINGVEQLASASGKFTINRTANTPPIVVLNFPLQDMFFKFDFNDSILFNFSATHINERNFTLKFYIDKVIYYTNTTYLNGTNASFRYVVGGGYHFWNVTAIDSFGNENSSAANFSVSPFNFSINFTIFDEFFGKPIKVPESNSTRLEVVFYNNSQNFSSTNGAFFINIYDVGDYRIKYSQDGYRSRNYYTTFRNGSHADIDLYLLSTTNGSFTTFTINNQNANAITNYTLKAQRFYANLNSYENVAMAKTDAQGQAQIDLQFNSAFYKFVLTSPNGTIITETIPNSIFSTSYTLRVNLGEDSFGNIRKGNLVYRNISFSNITNSFSLVYNDPNSIGEQICIYGYELSIKSGQTEVCNSCSTSASSTLVCDVSSSYSLNKTLVAKAFIYSKSGNNQTGTLLDVLTITPNELVQRVKNVMGVFGVLLGWMITTTMTMMGLWNPIAALIFGTLGFVISYIFGLITLGSSSLQLVVGIVLLAGIIAYRSRA